MKFILKYLLILKNNQFLKASFFSAFSTALKIITALVIVKVIAVKAGANGMAIYGQLLNFVTVTAILSGGAINDGIIKYVSEYKENNQSILSGLFSTALRYLFICSITVGLVIVLFSETFSIKILHSPKYSSVFVVFGFTLLFYGLNNFLLAILNGFKKFEKYNFISIIINLSSLFFTIVLIHFYGIFGALFGVVLNQSITFVITLYLLRNEVWFTKNNFRAKFDSKTFKLLLGYASFGLFTVAAAPLVSMIIRTIIIENISLQSAGYFEFVSRISSLALVFFSLTVSTYYLPRISEITNKKELLTEVKNTYKIIIPISFLLLFGVYVFRFLIIKILATKEFEVAENLFLFQLLGVFLRVVAQVCGFVFLAKAKIKIIIISELIFNILYILLTLFFVKRYALIGSSIAYFVYNIIYVITVLVIFKIVFYSNKKIEI